MQPTPRRTALARPLFAIIFTAVALWSTNALIIGALEFTLPSSVPPGAPWANPWSRLVQIYTSPLAVNDGPLGVGVLGLLVWWRTGSILRSLGVMVSAFIVWWMGLIAWRAISGVPLYL